jgi:hypothetical protein
MVVLQKPIMLSVDDCRGPLSFRTDDRVSWDPAIPLVTVIGRWKGSGARNRIDGRIGDITVQPQGMCPGVCLDRIDSATIGRIVVSEALEYGVELKSVRQSVVEHIIVHRVTTSGVRTNGAVMLTGQSGDCTNNVRVNYLEVSNCANRTYLWFKGHESSRVRSNSFGHVMLHTPWKSLKHDTTMFEFYEPRPRVLMQFDDADDNTIDNGTLRLDEEYAGETRAVSFARTTRGNCVRGKLVAPLPVGGWNLIHDFNGDNFVALHMRLS